jgi:hypothetical protein
MTIENRRQLENTRTKLRELELLCANTEQAAGADQHLRELTVRSLKKRIKQFKEEIARFETKRFASGVVGARFAHGTVLR